MDYDGVLDQGQVSDLLLLVLLPRLLVLLDLIRPLHPISLITSLSHLPHQWHLPHPFLNQRAHLVYADQVPQKQDTRMAIQAVAVVVVGDHH